MIRVYCKECKYLHRDENNPAFPFGCLHPSTKRVVITNDWFEGTTSTLIGDPKELNKNNDCPHYEEKT